jgi:hypothetical protein
MGPQLRHFMKRYEGGSPFGLVATSEEPVSESKLKKYQWVGFKELVPIVPLPLLRSCIGKSHPDVAHRVAAYLRSGSVVEDLSEEGVDRLDLDIELEPPVIQTDGEWVWRSDVAYYVEKYNAKLDEDFEKIALSRRVVVDVGIDVRNVYDWMIENYSGPGGFS